MCVCIYTYMDRLLPLQGRKDQTLISVLEVTQPFNFSEGVETKAKLKWEFNPHHKYNKGSIKNLK